MIENLPNWITNLFLLLVLLVILFFYLANGKPKKVTLSLIIWSLIHAILAYNGFYHNTTAIPPRFALILIPVSMAVIYGLLPKQKDWVFLNRNRVLSTFLHLVRLPVEIVLLQLFIHKMVPELMTFEGVNFDIIMGITAPIMGFLLWRNKLSKKVLLAWNVFGLVLITIILVVGILSAELPFQQFGFDQPNKAVTYFPFVLLPAVIVPVVIWTHILDILMLKMEIRAMA